MSRATAQQVARASALGCLRRTLINRSSRSSKSSLRFCRSDFLQPSRPSNSSRGRPGRPGVGLAQPSSGLPEVGLSMGRSYASSAEVRMKGDIDDLQITYRGAALSAYRHSRSHPHRRSARRGEVVTRAHRIARPEAIGCHSPRMPANHQAPVGTTALASIDLSALLLYCFLRN
jgi:hypothetical protein